MVADNDVEVSGSDAKTTTKAKPRLRARPRRGARSLMDEGEEGEEEVGSDVSVTDEEEEGEDSQGSESEEDEDEDDSNEEGEDEEEDEEEERGAVEGEKDAAGTDAKAANGSSTQGTAAWADMTEEDLALGGASSSRPTHQDRSRTANDEPERPPLTPAQLAKLEAKRERHRLKQREKRRLKSEARRQLKGDVATATGGEGKGKAKDAAEQDSTPADIPTIDFEDFEDAPDSSAAAALASTRRTHSGPASTLANHGEPSSPASSSAIDVATARRPATSAPTPSRPTRSAAAAEVYRQRLAEDPSYVPKVGAFWGHDERLLSRELRPMSGWWRGRGRVAPGWAGRGGRGAPWIGRGGARGSYPGAGVGRGGAYGVPREPVQERTREAETSKEGEFGPAEGTVDKASANAPEPSTEGASTATQASIPAPADSPTASAPKTPLDSKWTHDGYEALERTERLRAVRGRGGSVSDGSAAGRGGRGRGMWFGPPAFRGRGRGNFIPRGGFAVGRGGFRRGGGMVASFAPGARQAQASEPSAREAAEALVRDGGKDAEEGKVDDGQVHVNLGKGDQVESVSVGRTDALPTSELTALSLEDQHTETGNGQTEPIVVNLPGAGKAGSSPTPEQDADGVASMHQVANGHSPGTSAALRSQYEAVERARRHAVEEERKVRDELVQLEREQGVSAAEHVKEEPPLSVPPSLTSDGEAQPHQPLYMPLQQVASPLPPGLGMDAEGFLFDLSTGQRVGFTPPPPPPHLIYGGAEGHYPPYQAPYYAHYPPPPHSYHHRDQPPHYAIQRSQRFEPLSGPSSGPHTPEGGHAQVFDYGEAPRHVQVRADGPVQIPTPDQSTWRAEPTVSYPVEKPTGRVLGKHARQYSVIPASAAKAAAFTPSSGSSSAPASSAVVVAAPRPETFKTSGLVFGNFGSSDVLDKEDDEDRDGEVSKVSNFSAIGTQQTGSALPAASPPLEAFDPTYAATPSSMPYEGQSYEPWQTYERHHLPPYMYPQEAGTSLNEANNNAYSQAAPLPAGMGYESGGTVYFNTAPPMAMYDTRHQHADSGASMAPSSIAAGLNDPAIVSLSYGEEFLATNGMSW